MHGMGIQELIVTLIGALLTFGIPIAFAIWIIVAIKRLADGIKRVSARLDVVEKYLMDNETETTAGR
jgi:hypothetical protein